MKELILTNKNYKLLNYDNEYDIKYKNINIDNYYIKFYFNTRKNLIQKKIKFYNINSNITKINFYISIYKFTNNFLPNKYKYTKNTIIAYMDNILISKLNKNNNNYNSYIRCYKSKIKFKQIIRGVLICMFKYYYYNYYIYIKIQKWNNKLYIYNFYSIFSLFI